MFVRSWGGNSFMTSTKVETGLSVLLYAFPNQHSRPVRQDYYINVVCASQSIPYHDTCLPTERRQHNGSGNDKEAP